MRNSNIGNISIAIPTQSRLKSFSQFDDKSMIMDEEGGKQQIADINFNQNEQIKKWLQCRQKVIKRYRSVNENDTAKNANCYMIQIDEINDVQYRRKTISKESNKNNSRGPDYNTKNEDSSKIYIKIVANLLDTQAMDYSARTLQFNIVQLQQKSHYLYRVTQPRLAIFFHSKFSSESHFRVRFQLSVLQSNLIDMQEVVQNQEYLGYYDLDPFKGLKNRQRGLIYSQKLNANLDTAIFYTVLVSDSFKTLQKLIPINCLCSSEQAVAGLAGRKLPNTMSGLNYPIQYTQLHSLKIDVAAVNIPDTVINAKLSQCELFTKYSENVEIANATIKQVKLEAIFHNGWTSFCQASIKIEDRMQIQKKSSKKISTQVIKLKHYTAKQLLNLPFIFLDEQAILIFQVVAKIQVKCKSDFAHVQSFTVPLCYSHYSINKISVDEKQTRTLYIGQGVNQNGSQFGSKKHETVGKIEFYITIQHANKMQLSKHLVTLNSNKSGVDVDKIVLQKERMIRENRKLKHQNRIKKLQLNQQVPILDTTNYKENLYRNQIERMREQRKEKQEVLDYLRNKIKQLAPSVPLSEDDDGISRNQGDQNKFLNRSGDQNYFDAIFYKAAVQKSADGLSPVHNPDTIKVHMYPFIVNRETANLYSSGQVPLDVIKTQLLQKNYSYAIFINWISLLPVAEDKKLPRKFYFQVNFYQNLGLKSCICTINQNNGQIQVIPEQTKAEQKLQNQPKTFTRNAKNSANQQQNLKKQAKFKSQKIFYIEVAPDAKAKNQQNKFIDFISYLYHSQIQIKIIDEVSKCQFGEGFFKLRQCIRMRRNEVSIIRDIWIRRSGQTKAKLKVEIKTMRKQPNSSSSSNQKPYAASPLQSLSMQPEARQLQRIAQFKKHKQGQPSSAALSKVQKIINEELTQQQTYINVSRMKGEFIKIEVTNRKNFIQGYKVTINDPDRAYLQNQQLVVVNGLLFQSIKQTRWWKYLNSIQPTKYNNVIITDDRNCFQLSPGQTGSILLYYYSERKYEGNFHSDKLNKIYDTLHIEDQANKNINKGHFSNIIGGKIADNKLLTIYNHRHSIDLSLSNSTTSILQFLYKIHINPQADDPTISYSLARKSHSKLFIQIPFLAEKNYVLYIDDPTVISSLNESEGLAMLQCYAAGEGQAHKFNVSLLSPFPQNRLILNYKFELWGAHQIYISSQLWQIQDVLIDLHSSLCIKKGLQFILALSEDQKIITIRDKNPIKVNQKQAKTVIRLTTTATNIGVNHYQLNIISPVDFSIIYSYVIKISTEQPDIQQKLTLRIKLTDKMLEEPFGFKNDSIKKQKYRILTTHPHILWPNQQTIQVEAKSEKKVKIKINAEEVLQSEAVVLTFKTEKHCLHYLFVLQLDNQL